MVNRNEINQVIREQKFQNSGLIETEKIVEVGNLIGAEALISGSVRRPSMSDTHFYETRAECANRKCTKRDIAQRLAREMANDFTYKLTPHYVYFEVALIESGDLDYTDTEEQLLENALEYIKHNRLDKAERLLKELVDATQQQSVVKEAQGDFAKAKRYYEKADNLTVESVEVINSAYRIINKLRNNYKVLNGCFSGKKPVTQTKEFPSWYSDSQTNSSNALYAVAEATLSVSISSDFTSKTEVYNKNSILLLLKQGLMIPTIEKKL
ncbi:hypothetical protein P692DRAFT_20823697 [Suillus brevipes Sb2]|nr:hypothetical protein P692DRAFT_20823697 [Suillus brevipes Sb2]